MRILTTKITHVIVIAIVKHLVIGARLLIRQRCACTFSWDELPVFRDHAVGCLLVLRVETVTGS